MLALCWGGASPTLPVIFVGVVNAAGDALRSRELSRSFTRIALSSKTIPHGFHPYRSTTRTASGSDGITPHICVRQFFASRENDDFINCLFSAPCRWLCIRALVEEATV